MPEATSQVTGMFPDLQAVFRACSGSVAEATAR
jgi:hypothetical protein